MHCRKTNWTEAEKLILSAHYAEIGPKGVVEMLPRRNLQSIKMQASKQGIAYLGGRKKQTEYDSQYAWKAPSDCRDQDQRRMWAVQSNWNYPVTPGELRWMR